MQQNNKIRLLGEELGEGFGDGYGFGDGFGSGYGNGYAHVDFFINGSANTYTFPDTFKFTGGFGYGNNIDAHIKKRRN